MTLFPMLCACCRVNRHDLCATEDEISFCECAQCHPTRVIHPADTIIPAVDRQGRAIACAPTRAQYLAASAMTDHVHFVRNQEHTGGGE